MYQKRVRGIDELKQRLVEVWSHFSQAVVDEAIDEWRRRILACVRMKGHCQDLQFGWFNEQAFRHLAFRCLVFVK